MSKIVQLTASNVKRLQAVTIRPDGSTVVIGGRHGNGKSSVLDCIVYAITGTKSLPPVPLRNGTSKGFIDLDLGDLKIRRTFSRKGESDYTTSLKVTRANGDEVRGAQGVLDELCNSLAFDPLEFARLKPKAQLEALKELVKLDFTEVDAKRERLYSQRTEINRQHGAKKAEAANAPVVEGCGTEEISVTDRLQAVRDAEATNKKNADARRTLERAEAALSGRIAEVERLKALLETAEAAAAGARERVNVEKNIVANLLADADLAPLQESLANAEAMNDGVRTNRRRAELLAAADALSKQSEELTRQITDIDDRKAQAMKDAKFPVPGLSFGANGVLLNGLPLEQANTAAQIELSVAMGLALNPTLRVMLVRDGSSLFADETGLGLIAALAEKHDAQVWIERASVGEECSVIIDDGHVAGDEAESELEEAAA